MTFTHISCNKYYTLQRSLFKKQIMLRNVWTIHWWSSAAEVPDSQISSVPQFAFIYKNPIFKRIRFNPWISSSQRAALCSVCACEFCCYSQSNNCSLFFWTDDQDILLPIIEPSDHRDAGPQILDHWLEAQEEQLAAGSHHTRFFYATEPSKLHPSCQLQLDSGDQSYLSTVQIDWYRFALIRCFHCYSCPKSGG